MRDSGGTTRFNWGLIYQKAFFLCSYLAYENEVIVAMLVNHFLRGLTKLLDWVRAKMRRHIGSRYGDISDLWIKFYVESGGRYRARWRLF